MRTRLVRRSHFKCEDVTRNGLRLGRKHFRIGLRGAQPGGRLWAAHRVRVPRLHSCLEKEVKRAWLGPIAGRLTGLGRRRSCSWFGGGGLQILLSFCILAIRLESGRKVRLREGLGEEAGDRQSRWRRRCVEGRTCICCVVLHRSAMAGLGIGVPMSIRRRRCAVAWILARFLARARRFLLGVDIVRRVGTSTSGTHISWGRGWRRVEQGGLLYLRSCVLLLTTVVVGNLWSGRMGRSRHDDGWLENICSRCWKVKEKGEQTLKLSVKIRRQSTVDIRYLGRRQDKGR